MELRAKELRIGNLVSRLDLGDHSLRVESVLELRKDKVLTTGPISVICLYSETKPIPLTEEWILKFGFENNNFNKECFYKKYNQQGSFFIFSNKTSVAIANEITNPFYYMFGGLAHSLKYIHQLQNLFFDLTGEELSIKY